MWMISLFSLLILFISGSSQASDGCFKLNKNMISNSIVDLANSICLFQNPLIVGASVSKGFNANSGGAPAIVAKKLNPESKIINEAKNHTMAQDSLPTIDLDAINPSIVMGLDLFYWDAMNEKCDEDFTKKVNQFLDFYMNKKTPIILGVLPEKLSEPKGYAALKNKNCTKVINQYVTGKCTLEKNCLIYNPELAIREVSSNLNAQDKNLKQYFPDGLHPSIQTNKLLAENFIQNGNFNKLQCNPE